MLRVTLLGEFRIQYHDATINDVNTPRLQSLLAYLLLHHDIPQTRSHLAFLFWPDTSEVQARTNLRNLLHHLRHALPDADKYLVSSGSSVYWRTDSQFTLDVNQLQVALAQVSNGMKENLEVALELYKGDLLPGCYDDWVIPYREALRQSFTNTLEMLIQITETERNYRKAISLAERLLRYDPLSEGAYRTLIRLHAMHGDRAAALRTYHVCATVLHRELGVTPSISTRTAYEQLLNTEVIPTQPLPQVASFAALIGRNNEWSHMLERWHAAVSGEGPQVLFLSGEAGIGKTRLLEELQQWALRQGIQCSYARCYAAEGQLAFAPIVDWLRAHPLPFLEDAWLSEVARLLPEVLSHHPKLQKPAALLENWQRQILFEGLSRALLGSKGSTLLIMDDLHWCDHDSLEFLHFLLRFDQSARLLIVGTYRPEEVGPSHTLQQILQALRVSGQATELEMVPLNELETGTLAEQILGKSLETEAAIRLYQETEGNPLFVVETVRAGLVNAFRKELKEENQERSTQAVILPRKVRSVLEARLAQLSAPAADLAKLAAVIGRAFNTNLIQKASGLEEHCLVQVLDELWQHHIIRESGMDAYDFSHDKLREVAYQSMSSARKRLLHRQVAEALENLSPQALNPISQQLAAHYEQAGLDDKAIVYYLRAAQVARQVFANTDAVNLLQHGLKLSQEAALVDWIPQLWEEMGDVNTLMVKHEDALNSFQSALDSLNVANPQHQARLLRKMSEVKREQRLYLDALDLCSRADVVLGDPKEDDSNFLWWEGWLEVQVEKIWAYYWLANWQEMDALVFNLEPLVQSHASPSSHLRFLLASCLMNLRKFRYVVSDKMLEHSKEALKLSSDYGSLRTKLDCQFELGFLHLWRRELDAAQEALYKALEGATNAKILPLWVLSLTYLTVVFRFMGQLDAVSDFSHRAGEMAQDAHMPDYVATALANQAWIAWRNGNLPETKKLGEQALVIWQQSPLVYPFQWMALFPLIAAAHGQEREDEVGLYIHALLEHTQQILPDPLNHMLKTTNQSKRTGFEGEAQNYLDQVLTLSKTLGYL